MPNTDASSKPTGLGDIVAPQDVVDGLAVAGKAELLRALARQAALRLGCDAEAIVAALARREGLGSTGIGNGVAVPHACLTDLAAPFTLVARLGKPVDFEAIDERPVDIVFMVLVPAERPSAHLNILSAIARKARVPNWLAAGPADELFARLTEPFAPPPTS